MFSLLLNQQSHCSACPCGQESSRRQQIFWPFADWTLEVISPHDETEVLVSIEKMAMHTVVSDEKMVT
jgi:hypothetical protein